MLEYRFFSILKVLGYGSLAAIHCGDVALTFENSESLLDSVLVSEISTSEKFPLSHIINKFSRLKITLCKNGIRTIIIS